MQIILVTTSDALCKEMKELLEGHDFSAASNSSDTLDLIDDLKTVDLIFVDIDLPGDNAFKLIKCIKNSAKNKNIIIIMLTGSGEPSPEMMGFQMGADDYLAKPLNKESFNAVIELYSELLGQRAARQKNIEYSSIFNAIFDQSPVGIAIYHRDRPMSEERDEFFNINPAYESITGRDREELLRMGWADITHPDDIGEEKNNYRDLIEGKIKSYSMEKRFIKPDGSISWAHVTSAPLVLSNGHEHNHICLVQDITEKKLAQDALLESERSKSVILSHFPGMAYRCFYDNNWTMQFVSKGCKRLTGYGAENLLENKRVSFNEIIAPEYRQSLRKEWERSISKKIPFKFEYEIISANQKRKWVLEMGEAIYDSQGGIEALEGIIIDISDRKKIEEELRYNNEHDPCTGLYNRRYLDNFLARKLKKNKKTKKAIILINLSGLYALAITYGYYYHRSMIKKIAEALSSFGTNKCFLFHTSENRFLFYINGYEEQKELEDFCESIADTLESLLHSERVAGGIGILEIDRNSIQDMDNLVNNALIASERAIGLHGKDFNHCIFDLRMKKQILREEQIKQELSQIAAGEGEHRLFLEFQPILDIKTGEIWGFEALARFNSSTLGLVPPLEFIPIAEQTKLIIPLGELIIQKAFKFLNDLESKKHFNVNISINVSAIQFFKEDFSKNLLNAMYRMNVNPQRVCLEITESTFSSNYQELNRILGELKDLGINTAIDDFGTGYSSLAREWELNVNSLKLDRYFINKLLRLEALENAITGDIISMAHRLGHYVVAEGVEEECQMNYLRENGCDKVQGYLISKPLGDEEAIKFLDEYTCY